jgi:hypothetical protein
MIASTLGDSIPNVGLLKAFVNAITIVIKVAMLFGE